MDIFMSIKKQISAKVCAFTQVDDDSRRAASSQPIVFVPHDLLIIFFKIPKYLKNFYSQTVAWETTSSTCPEDPAVPMRPVQVVAAVQDMPNLPGTVADDGIDHRPSLPNTHFDQCKNSPVGGVLTSSPQLRRGVSSTKSSQFSTYDLRQQIDSSVDISSIFPLREDGHGLTAHPHSCVGKYRWESRRGENVKDREG